MPREILTSNLEWGTVSKRHKDFNSLQITLDIGGLHGGLSGRCCDGGSGCSCRGGSGSGCSRSGSGGSSSGGGSGCSSSGGGSGGSSSSDGGEGLFGGLWCLRLCILGRRWVLALYRVVLWVERIMMIWVDATHHVGVRRASVRSLGLLRISVRLFRGRWWRCKPW